MKRLISTLTPIFLISIAVSQVNLDFSESESQEATLAIKTDEVCTYFLEKSKDLDSWEFVGTYKIGSGKVEIETIIKEDPSSFYRYEIRRSNFVNPHDTDGDGINNATELVLPGYKPNDADSDGDGILDGEEDLDNDGVCNQDEIGALPAKLINKVNYRIVTGYSQDSYCSEFPDDPLCLGDLTDTDNPFHSYFDIQDDSLDGIYHPSIASDLADPEHVNYDPTYDSNSSDYIPERDYTNPFYNPYADPNNESYYNPIADRTSSLYNPLTDRSSPHYDEINDPLSPSYAPPIDLNVSTFDTDGDGINNATEDAITGYDPDNPDSDGDGINDGYEDLDEDGVSNLNEIGLTPDDLQAQVTFRIITGFDPFNEPGSFCDLDENKEQESCLGDLTDLNHPFYNYLTYGDSDPYDQEYTLDPTCPHYDRRLDPNHPSFTGWVDPNTSADSGTFAYYDPDKPKETPEEAIPKFIKTSDPKYEEYFRRSIYYMAELDPTTNVPNYDYQGNLDPDDPATWDQYYFINQLRFSVYFLTTYDKSNIAYESMFDITSDFYFGRNPFTKATLTDLMLYEINNPESWRYDPHSEFYFPILDSSSDRFAVDYDSWTFRDVIFPDEWAFLNYTERDEWVSPIVKSMVVSHSGSKSYDPEHENYNPTYDPSSELYYNPH